MEGLQNGLSLLYNDGMALGWHSLLYNDGMALGGIVYCIMTVWHWGNIVCNIIGTIKIFRNFLDGVNV